MCDAMHESGNAGLTAIPVEEAVGSVLLPGLVIGFVCGCLVIAILMLLGPAIGDVFSTINQSLGGY